METWTKVSLMCWVGNLLQMTSSLFLQGARIDSECACASNTHSPSSSPHLSSPACLSRAILLSRRQIDVAVTSPYFSHKRISPGNCKVITPRQRSLGETWAQSYQGRWAVLRSFSLGFDVQQKTPLFTARDHEADDKGRWLASEDLYEAFQKFWWKEREGEKKRSYQLLHCGVVVNRKQKEDNFIMQCFVVFILELHLD